MEYLKNIVFTKVIKTANRSREFNFRKKTGTPNPQYSVDVSDEKGIRHYFILVKINDRWNFGELDIPAWIREGSGYFHDAIKEYESPKL